ncbi:putative ATP-dependent RNA helicase kurz [Armadillidium vulgare]|nr:putative ATP-dependent RNA helicase kurz [Armadillidium vulgare]
MEAINENPITIVVGPTGSGKTTQIPQFLYEAGFTNNGMLIGVTEPRRIAAISMAERIGYELNLPSSKVSYQIRYEGNVTPETEIKFMTDGVLFQEIKNNHFLNNYSAIIIDEVHERSVHSDILLGLLSRIVPQRSKRGKPLKLIIMSATPRIEDFTQNANLFNEGIPPVITVPSRLYDVTIHFNKATNPDYCESAFKKICSIHRQLPDGGILVFLTGQQEILELCKRLKETFPLKQNGATENDSVNGKKKKKIGKRKSKNEITIPDVNLKDFVIKSPEKKGREVEEVVEIPDEEIFSEEISRNFLVENENPLWVLPLYSLLPSYKQKRVFEPPPEGTRLCVVATNIAETSLTIPNIKYVVDSGKTKEKRSGRAGRTSDGHCYRLYSSAVYNDQFLQYTIPDIQKRPLDDVVLAMKALKIPVYKFPFPSPPDPKYLSESFKRLTVLGALEESSKLLSLKKSRNMDMDITVITNLGYNISCFPMAPRFAKIVLNCHQRPEIYPYVVIIIAALTVREIFIEIPLAGNDLHPIHQNWAEQRIKWSGKGRSHLLGDLLVLINAVLEAEKNDFSFQWCYENGLRHSALLEYRKLRRQLTNEINVLIDDANITLHPGLKPPTDDQAYLLAEIIFIGSVDQVARRVDSSEFHTEEERKMWRNAYRTVYSDRPAFLSSASALHKDKPQYIMYQEIYESTKVYLRCATVVNEAWLLFHGDSLADLSPPLDVPQPSFDSRLDRVMCHRKGTFGPQKWELRAYPVEFPTTQDLFKWVAYFFLIGELWPPLKPHVKYLYDPKTLISPITLRYREKRQNLMKALFSENIKSGSDLQRVWRKNPHFLKSEYFSWFENEEKLALISLKWPPLEEDEYLVCNSDVHSA